MRACDGITDRILQFRVLLLHFWRSKLLSLWRLSRELVPFCTECILVVDCAVFCLSDGVNVQAIGLSETVVSATTTHLYPLSYRVAGSVALNDGTIGSSLDTWYDARKVTCGSGVDWVTGSRWGPLTSKNESTVTFPVFRTLRESQTVQTGLAARR